MSQGLCDIQSGNHSHLFHAVVRDSGSNLRFIWGEEGEGLSQREQPHLLPILMLQMQPRLDVTTGFLKGLALRHLSRVVCADANDIGAEEQQHVGTELQEVAEANG